MEVEDVRHLSVSRQWGKVLLPQTFQMIKTCCSFPSVLQNLQPPARKTGMLLFTLIFTELLDTSLAQSRGVEWLMMSWTTGGYTEGFSDACIILSLHHSAPFLCTWVIRNSCVNRRWFYRGFFNGHARRLWMLTALSWTKSVRNSAQTMAVLKIRLARRGMLNPKWWTIILYQCKHEGTRDAVVVGMQL